MPSSQARGPLVDRSVGRWAKQLQDTLGLQDVSVYGVPADSRVARVIVEADYRMKLIGVGKLDGGSHDSRLLRLLAEHPEQATGSLDGLRWWLTLQLRRRPAQPRSRSLRDPRLVRQCLSENEFINEQGQQVHTGKAEPTNRLFATNFTEHYADLASRDPVFADMQGSSISPSSPR